MLTVANYDRQANFERDLLLLRCSSTHSITHSSYGGRRRLSSYTVDHLLSSVQVHAILRLRTCGLCNLRIAYMCYPISRLRTRVTQSRDCLRNLGIPRMRNAISRLRKFPDCAEHMYKDLKSIRNVKGCRDGMPN